MENNVSRHGKVMEFDYQMSLTGESNLLEEHLVPVDGEQVLRHVHQLVHLLRLQHTRERYTWFYDLASHHTYGTCLRSPREYSHLLIKVTLAQHQMISHCEKFL